jgi:hypothetical protein
MRHFIAYHNTQRMGWHLHDGDPCRLLTRKPVEQLLNQVVWFVVGEASRPRRYSLGSVFVVREVGPSDQAGFRYFACGPGHAFRPAPLLSGLGWFAALLEAVGRFQFGVQEVRTPALIKELCGLAALQGYRLPGDAPPAEPTAAVRCAGWPTRKALSLKQPWAALLVAGLKTVEVRRWPTDHRGPLLIHAANLPDQRPEAWKHVPAELHPATELRAGVIGAAELVECRAYRRREAFAADGGLHLNDPDWFEPAGLFGFRFEGARPLPFFRYPGWVRIFKVEEDDPRVVRRPQGQG